MMVLFKKDLLISIKIIVLILLFNFFIGITLYTIDDNYAAQNRYFTMVSFSALSILTSIIVEDDKYNTAMLFNSLPIERKTIVKSKYLTMGVIPFLYGIFIYIVSRLYGLSNSIMFIFAARNLFSFNAMVYSIIMTIILLSLFLPVYFSSVEKSKKIGSVLVFLVVLYPFILIRLDNGANASLFIYLFQKANIVFLIATTIILYFLSMIFSISIYNKKEI